MRWLLVLLAGGGLIVAIVIAFVFGVGVYRAPSESMDPTILVGDRLAVLKVGQPKVGDIVALHPPKGHSPSTSTPAAWAAQARGGCARCAPTRQRT